MRSTRTTAVVLIALLTCLAGCPQVLGLGDYAEGLQDGGEGDATVGDDATDQASNDAMTGADGANDGATVDEAPAADGGTEDADADMAPNGDAALQDASAPDAQGVSCTGALACAPQVPPGWTGPLAIWEGTSGAPSCATGFVPVFDGGVSPTDPPAQCSCSCQSPTGAGCGSVTMQFTKTGCTTACGPSGGAAVVPSSGACVNLQQYQTGCGGGMEVSISGSIADGGSCTPDASTTLPPWSWGTRAIGCIVASQSPVGCPVGQECVPAPPSPFEARFCILQQGANPCPSGDYSVQHLYYGAVADTRGCSACTCGAAAGIDCDTNSVLQTWSDSLCSQVKLATLPVPQACGTDAGVLRGATFTTRPTGGSCPASGGQPGGSVAPAALTTICCTP